MEHEVNLFQDSGINCFPDQAIARAVDAGLEAVWRGDSVIDIFRKLQQCAMFSGQDRSRITGSASIILAGELEGCGNPELLPKAEQLIELLISSLSAPS